jgi:hypothetical protein
MDIQELNKALKTIAEVCEKHVATAKEHREIAKALETIVKALTESTKDKKEGTLETENNG